MKDKPDDRLLKDSQKSRKTNQRLFAVALIILWLLVYLVIHFNILK
ncbi:hypothetical protein AB6735_22210 [Mucilaginibacter sp. RCC_168]